MPENASLSHRSSPLFYLRSVSAGAWHTLAIPCLFLAFIVCGCTQPYPGGYPGQVPPGGLAAQPGAVPGVAPGPASVYAQQQTHPQLVELQKKVQTLDENNRDLTTQIAQAQQQAQAFRERSELLARQLEDATNQNKQLLATAQQYADKAVGMQASMQQMQDSMRMRGGARLTANNSLNQAATFQISGAQVIPDGDVIRIRISADQLFGQASAQLSPGAAMILDQVANKLVRQYPRQRVAVEGHTDATSAMGGYQTMYQVASAQAQAVIDYLVRRGGVPSQQLFITAHGPNHPVADNQTPAGRAENRRIEIVIYPETY